MIFYRIYQICIMLPLLLVATVLCGFVTVAGCALGGGKWWGFKPASLWGRLWCVLAGVRVQVRGRDNINPGTSYVFVANHQGAYDIFSIYGYLHHDFRWVMKQSAASWYSPKVRAHPTGACTPSSAEPTRWPSNSACPWCPSPSTAHTA